MSRRWFGTYSCSGGDAVWSPPLAPHWEVDEATAGWTVRTAALSGVGAVVTRHAAMAYFVGIYRR